MYVNSKTRLGRYARPALLSAAILCAVVLIIVFLRPIEPQGARRLVTFYDRGKQHVVLTHADSVEDALAGSGIDINPQDVVEPSRGSRLTSPHEDVIIYRSRLVAIADGTVRQSVVTVAQSPNAVLADAKLQELGPKDNASFIKGDLAADKSSVLLMVERAQETPAPVKKPVFAPGPYALTASKGAQVFVDSKGVAHRETYYDLPMNIVILACGAGGTYTIRSDGAKVDQDGYVLVAANLVSYPRCSVVETSMGPGKVYDTGGFALRHPYGFDLATDWTNYNGR